MTTQRSLIYRVDGYFSIGMGHIMRSLCLVKEVLLPLRISPFFIVKGDEHAKNRLDREGVNAQILPENSSTEDELTIFHDTITSLAPHSVITDVPYMKKKTGYENIIQQHKVWHMVFDDLYLTNIQGNVVINSSVFEKSLSPPSQAQQTTYCRGPQYAIINEQVRKKRTEKRVRKQVTSIAVSLGGSDPRNFTHTVLNGLCALPFPLDIHVIVGPAFRKERMASLLEEYQGSSHHIILHQHLENIGEIISIADIAVVSGGITAYEAACVGAPSLIVCQTPQQENAAKTLDHMGIAENCGYRQVTPDKIAAKAERLITDYEKRNQMFEKGRRTVDGKGVERIKKIFTDRYGTE